MRAAHTGRAVTVAVESDSLEFLRNYVRREAVASFQVPSGIPADRKGLCVRPLDARDMPPTQIVLGQLNGRSLSIAASKFADQVANNLHRQHGLLAPG